MLNKVKEVWKHKHLMFLLLTTLITVPVDSVMQGLRCYQVLLEDNVLSTVI